MIIMKLNELEVITLTQIFNCNRGERSDFNATLTHVSSLQKTTSRRKDKQNKAACQQIFQITRNAVFYVSMRLQCVLAV